MKIINDKYRETRGGFSRIYEIYCKKCKKHLFTYQKDGLGPLKRLYDDRAKFTGAIQIKPLDTVVCKKCRTQIGCSIIYEKENRPAIRIHRRRVELMEIYDDRLVKKL